MERIIEYIFIAIGLSMDAFAVSITIGCTMKSFKIKNALLVALFFGFFQAIMPLFGWLAGIGFSKYIEQIDHWIAFILLLFIGAKMIYESVKMKDTEDESKNKDYFKITTLLLFSIATSIDALAVGITFSILQIFIITPIIIIGVMTFCFSLFGVLLGCKTSKYLFENKIEIIGGVILILIGLKILIEHLFF